MTVVLHSTSPEGTIEIRRLTVQDYHQMIEAGILTSDERVELIEGQLYRMAAKGTAHSAAMTRIKRILESQIGNQVLLRFQDPVQLSDDSEPEPDIAIVQLDPVDYEDHHPTPAEIYWLIEVSDRTLKRDKDLKASVYAKAGITEYWILDINNRQMFVFREPSSCGYAHEQILAETESISPLAFADCQVRVGDFFKPQFS